MIVPGDPGEGPGLIQRDGCATGLVIEVRASEIIEGISSFFPKNLSDLYLSSAHPIKLLGGHVNSL